MLDLQLDQGFESSSGFREAFAKVFGTAPSLAHDVDCLYAKWFETPLGPMLDGVLEPAWLPGISRRELGHQPPGARPG